VVLATAPIVPVTVLPDHLLQAGGLGMRRDESGRLPADASLFEIVADYERRVILEHLEAAGWSQTDAAATLRVPLSTLNQKIKRLSIEIRWKSDASRPERVS
jgi:DNA-binding NtrC family response regulator